VGTKTAERFAFKVLHWQPEELAQLSALLKKVTETITRCVRCRCLAEEGECFFCNDTARDKTTLCLVGSPRDVYAIEETGSYRGSYHVLGALLSPLEGMSPEQVGVAALRRRVEEEGVSELIIALDSTLEGDATALFLKEELEGSGVRIFRLALGMPMGSSLDFVDGGTLARSFAGRQQF
jgi:recombination protein RecR